MFIYRAPLLQVTEGSLIAGTCTDGVMVYHTIKICASYRLLEAWTIKD